MWPLECLLLVNSLFWISHLGASFAVENGYLLPFYTDGTDLFKDMYLLDVKEHHILWYNNEIVFSVGFQKYCLFLRSMYVESHVAIK